MPAIVYSKAHKALVDVLITRRNRARLTQAEVADGAGFTQQQISDIETCRRGIQAAELPALARGYRVSLATIARIWEALLSV